ncbi:MAG: LysM peptidoglycan-binding domain-containing protein [Ruminococcus sp.]|nr:LysM peptidoglycan-binding domain-containing protein [Ruminococcus sp.]
MVISNMRFDSFEWAHNPLTVQVTHKRRMTQQNMAGGGSFVSNAGCELKVIKGKGELAGENCTQEFQRLCDLFERGKRGLLTLPFMAPFYAYFTDLSLTGEPTPELITYTFEFTQAENSEYALTADGEAVVKESETLFDIAYRCGVDVEELVRLNPQIKRPDELTAGEVVRLC